MSYHVSGDFTIIVPTDVETVIAITALPADVENELDGGADRVCNINQLLGPEGPSLLL